MRFPHIKWHLLVILHDTVCTDMYQGGAGKWRSEAHKTSIIYTVRAISYDIIMDLNVIHCFSAWVCWSALKGERQPYALSLLT